MVEYELINFFLFEMKSGLITKFEKDLKSMGLSLIFLILKERVVSSLLRRFLSFRRRFFGFLAIVFNVAGN